MIIEGRARPSFIVNHRLPLSEARAYEHFDKRRVDDGQDWTKVILKPGMEAAPANGHGHAKAATHGAK